jgi:hypothetical protein
MPSTPSSTARDGARGIGQEDMLPGLGREALGFGEAPGFRREIGQQRPQAGFRDAMDGDRGRGRCNDEAVHGGGYLMGRATEAS